MALIGFVCSGVPRARAFVETRSVSKSTGANFARVARRCGRVVAMAAEKSDAPTAKFTPGTGKVSKSAEKMKLEPEEVFFDGKPSWTELVVPALTILTVIGIIPFIAAAARQVWVKYRVTSRRIAVDGGFQGKDHVEIVYRDIEEIRYIRRMGGSAADMVIFLRDGAKLELRSVPDFKNIYGFILKQLPEDAREKSQPSF
uniref:YdbS-like PH domain-containing protein n=1 Tax=Erythrolobus madagascarensis TaxID=708628 RepID=A0A7S0T572_9RHOD|mmetsp:Transcript_1000/g.1955  ORF Transcript_1000/g.1955 Transcript_1000/m.1955 type:complete len:200 (+) Transcript_1000:68-667(+)|eukprot:CAMPEP_0185846280 /NCGR_PEP_ID=MMETSP1354-20130828/1976_1 /TAXON_ID=708628 /ORGANISM="Erythrolobus madagascarensis, Strain CCMP3276" /LENGTH=199 /DNA_ID=CAMNT_0028546389 /DNA_START=42 /DNA_END=641 /DNA_ORIENTATION=-